MTSITIITDPTVILRALEKARAVGVDEIKGVAAPVFASLKGWLDEAWGAIEAAINDAYQYGKEKVEQAYTLAATTVEEILKKAGVMARELHRMLIKKVAEFTQEALSAALAQMAATIQVGNAMLSLASVKCAQKIALGGELKSSIHELIKFVANGELNIEVNYAMSGSDA